MTINCKRCGKEFELKRKSKAKHCSFHCARIGNKNAKVFKHTLETRKKVSLAGLGRKSAINISVL